MDQKSFKNVNILHLLKMGLPWILIMHHYTDNFTQGTPECCLNYSVLLQSAVKTGTEIMNYF